MNVSVLIVVYSQIYEKTFVYNNLSNEDSGLRYYSLRKYSSLHISDTCSSQQIFTSDVQLFSRHMLELKPEVCADCVQTT